MRKNETVRVVLIAAVLILAAYFFYPTAKLWLMSDEDKAALMRTTEGMLYLKKLESDAINLGLDLQGGMHIVLKVDVSEMSAAEASDARDRALQIIRNRVDKYGVNEPQIIPQGEHYIVVELPGLQDVKRAQELIGKTAQLEFRFLETPEKAAKLVRDIDKILGSDPFAGEESDQGETTVAGEDDSVSTEDLTEAAEKLFEDSGDAAAELEALTSDSTDSSELFDDYLEPDANPFSGYLVSDGQGFYDVDANDYRVVNRLLALQKVQALTPPDDEWMWGTRDEPRQGRMTRKLYLVKKKVEMRGDCLKSADPTYGGNFNTPEVRFRLNKECGTRFARITGPNIGKPLAIILDGRVESAPTIQSRLRDDGVITMGGGATFEQAKDLAIVLQAGALPAPVKIVENNVVGPSLGHDSISKGLAASIIGLLFVVVIMAFYYRLSGLVADFALVFNLFVLLAVMSAAGATLTVPGIAGIILLVGISVDAAVLIFERIREELVTGKSVRAAIDAGYGRAAVAIIDSNITTLIVAGILYAFGTGPVKGFAVTLSIGILVSLFSALVVTRTIFEFRKSYTKLSI